MFPTNAFESKESCDGGCCTRRRMAAFTIQAARSHRRPVDGWRHPDGADRLWSGVRRAPDDLLLHHADAHPRLVWSRARVAGYFVRESWSGRAGQCGAVASGAARRRHAQPSLLTVPLLFGLLAGRGAVAVFACTCVALSLAASAWVYASCTGGRHTATQVRPRPPPPAPTPLRPPWRAERARPCTPSPRFALTSSSRSWPAESVLLDWAGRGFVGHPRPPACRAVRASPRASAPRRDRSPRVRSHCNAGRRGLRAGNATGARLPGEVTAREGYQARLLGDATGSAACGCAAAGLPLPPAACLAAPRAPRRPPTRARECVAPRPQPTRGVGPHCSAGCRS